MTALVAGAAALYDLICVGAGDGLPQPAEVGALAPSPGAAGQWLPGGAAPTIARAMRRQGCAVALFHPLPPAGQGDPMRDTLSQAGIDVSRAPPADAAHCIIIAAAARLAWSGTPDTTGMHITDALLDGITHVVIASRWGAWTSRLLDEAAARHIPCSLIGEPASEAVAHSWHCVVLDAAQAAALLPVRAHYRVVTNGAAGATLYHGVETRHIPAQTIAAIDTTGAGDTFGGTFLARLLNGDDPVSAAHAATRAAAECCGQWGAWGKARGSAPGPRWGQRPQTRIPGVRTGGPDSRECGSGGAAPSGVQGQSPWPFPMRLRGALMGLACGDAFGMPNSFLPAPPWRDTMQPGPPDSPYHAGYSSGRITDDTEQALALTAALENGFSPLAVATRLNDWFVAVGGASSLAVGPSTRRAMLAFQQGEDVASIGRTGVTNGGAMRVAPIGVYAALCGMDLPRLVDQVEIACMPTHHTSPAIAGAAAIAAAVAAGVQGADWPTVMRQAQDAARLGATRGAWIYAPDIAARIAQACEIAAACDTDAGLIAAMSDLVGAGEPTTESVPAALAIADYAGGDPARAIRLAGNLRGDTDTVAAMAGAVCGAYAGIDALPPEWVSLVRATNNLDEIEWADRLVRCARA